MRRVLLIGLTVFGLCAAPSVGYAQASQAKGGAKAKASTASGTVKSVSGNQLVVASGGKDMTFTIDTSTKFTGRGLGTKAKAGGGTIAATDAVHEGDSVSVTYHDMGGTMHAASVRVTSSKPAAKK